MAKLIFNAGVFKDSPLFAASTATQITVLDRADDTLASLWSDRDGTVVKSNPHFISSAGKIEFYADPGRYRITATNGGFTQIWEDVLIIDPDAGGGGGGSGNVPAGGTTGQVLAKASSANYDTAWVPAGGVGVSALSIVSGVVTVDLALGNLFTLAMTADVTGWVFTNKPGVGNGGSIMIRVTQGSPARALALPVGSEWTDGSATALDAADGRAHVLAMTSFDNFSTVDATMAKRGSA